MQYLTDHKSTDSYSGFWKLGVAFLHSLTAIVVVTYDSIGLYNIFSLYYS